jgi:hypothetical protein
VLSASDIAKKCEVVKRVAEPIMNRPAPPPPKKEEAAAPPAGEQAMVSAWHVV